MGNNVIYELSKKFAIRIIKLYVFLKEEKHEFVMSKQIYRCGTSIGANIAESTYAQSTPDYISKLSISLKEASETQYWLDLLQESNYISRLRPSLPCERVRRAFGGRGGMVKEFISQLPPDKLSPFAKHPYRVREDAAMDELTESIRVHGILSPLLARPKGDGYELVSGHRRRLAAQKLGLPTVPVLVREMTDDEAVILMVDSNLQRENLLPSEKAKAYKLKLDAMKRSAGRPAKNSAQVGQNFHRMIS